jgi:hypothetical protein
MLKGLIVLLVCIGVSYTMGLHHVRPAEIIERNQSFYFTQNNTLYNLTPCIQKLTVSQTRPEIRYVYVQMNVTDKQQKKILNLRPKNCENIGCSFGYILGKYDCMDILNLPHPKFSERPSIGYDKPENISYLPMKHDGFGYYLELPSENWHIYEGKMDFYGALNFTTYRNGSIKELNNGSYHNKTRVLWTYRMNETKNSNEIYLRLISP